MPGNHTRDTMSPSYRPVPASLDVSTPQGVAAYYPNLADVAFLDPDERLPFMHTVHRAKVVWTVVFEGVVGEVNLVVKYNTTFADAAAGRAPKNGEVSLRIRREDAGEEAEGEGGEGRLRRALDAVAYAAQAFRNEGWDEKTAAVDVDPPAPEDGEREDDGEWEDDDGEWEDDEGGDDKGDEDEEEDNTVVVEVL